MPQSRARKTYLAIYGTALSLGSIALFGSIALQLWGQTGAHDGARPHKHRSFCTGQLYNLRQELEEATVQDFARGRRATQLTRVEVARRRTWGQRLQEVQARCADLPVHTASAAQLLELEQGYGALVDEMHHLRQHTAEPLDQTLDRLKQPF